jgi:hypothetical protein
MKAPAGGIGELFSHSDNKSPKSQFFGRVCVPGCLLEMCD